MTWTGEGVRIFPLLILTDVRKVGDPAHAFYCTSWNQTPQLPFMCSFLLTCHILFFYPTVLMCCCCFFQEIINAWIIAKLSNQNTNTEVTVHWKILVIPFKHPSAHSSGFHRPEPARPLAPGPRRHFFGAEVPRRENPPTVMTTFWQIQCFCGVTITLSQVISDTQAQTTSCVWERLGSAGWNHQPGETAAYSPPSCCSLPSLELIT